MFLSHRQGPVDLAQLVRSEVQFSLSGALPANTERESSNCLNVTKE